MPDNDVDRIMEKIRTVSPTPVGIVDRLLRLVGSNDIVYTNVGQVDEARSIQVVVFTRTAMLVQTFPANYPPKAGVLNLEAWPRCQLHHVSLSERFEVLPADLGAYRVEHAGNSCANLHYKNRSEPIKLFAEQSADGSRELFAFLSSLITD